MHVRDYRLLFGLGLSSRLQACLLSVCLSSICMLVYYPYACLVSVCLSSSLLSREALRASTTGGASRPHNGGRFAPYQRRALRSGHCSRAIALRPLLSGHCSRAIALGPSLSGYCSRAIALGSLLSGNCSRAIALAQLLSGNCSRAIALGQLLSGYCSRAIALGLLSGNCSRACMQALSGHFPSTFWALSADFDFSARGTDKKIVFPRDPDLFSYLSPI